jgi:hypothetical protein
LSEIEVITIRIMCSFNFQSDTESLIGLCSRSVVMNVSFGLQVDSLFLC